MSTRPVFYCFSHKKPNITPSVICVLETSLERARIKFFRLLLGKKFISVHRSYDKMYINSVEVDTLSTSSLQATLKALAPHKIRISAALLIISAQHYLFIN